MINWIKGDLIDLWQINNKYFILINCQGLGYEVQILESNFLKLNSSKATHNKIILWLKHIKKEDSDSLYGFTSKEQKDFFIEILNVKGIGAQIGMALLNQFPINVIVEAINKKDKNLISSVPGIGQKMTERLILELKNKLIKDLKVQDQIKEIEFTTNNPELSKIIKDLEITLNSLNYPKKDIKKILPILINEFTNVDNKSERSNNLSFENILKIAMDYLDKR